MSLQILPLLPGFITIKITVLHIKVNFTHYMSNIMYVTASPVSCLYKVVRIKMLYVAINLIQNVMLYCCVYRYKQYKFEG